MLRTLLVWIWLTVGLLASSQTLQYDVKFSIFGTIGSVQNTITISHGRYEIRSRIQAAPYIQKIFGNYVATHISKGRYQNGRFVSESFESISYEKKKKRHKIYKIDYRKKVVHKSETISVSNKVVHRHRQAMSFHGSDDVLTLYFNAGYYAKHVQANRFTIKVAGLEKQKQTVTLRKLHPKHIDRALRITSQNALYLAADIISKNIRSKQKNVLLAIGKDGMIEKALIKDVLLYGDAKVIRVK